MPQTHPCAMVYTGRSWVVYIGRLQVAHIERLWVANTMRLWVAHIERLRVANTMRLWVANTMRSRMDHYNPVNDKRTISIDIAQFVPQDQVRATFRKSRTGDLCRLFGNGAEVSRM